jgi:branched-chain amino acid transport system substrate-binding protein
MKIHRQSLAQGLLLGILASTACYAQEPIKIEVVTPLSGTYAGVGQLVRWGLELAAQEINEAGGIARRTEKFRAGGRLQLFDSLAG